MNFVELKYSDIPNNFMKLNNIAGMNIWQGYSNFDLFEIGLKFISQHIKYYTFIFLYNKGNLKDWTKLKLIDQ